MPHTYYTSDTCCCWHFLWYVFHLMLCEAARQQMKCKNWRNAAVILGTQCLWVCLYLLLHFFVLAKQPAHFGTDLWHQWGIFHKSLDIASFLGVLSVKIPVEQQQEKHSDQPVCSKSHFNLLPPPSWCSVWTSASHHHHRYKTKSMELQPSHGLFSLFSRLQELPLTFPMALHCQTSIGRWWIKLV